MSEINIPHEEQVAILAIDVRQLEKLVDQAFIEKSANVLNVLRLGDCGPYISAQLRDFRSALVDYGAAKSYKKISETEQSARRSGSRLASAVGQMKYRVEQEQAESLRFRIDDNIFTPLRFSPTLRVWISYSWRPTVDAEWQHGSIEFTHEADLRPAYTAPQPKRKPSVAKQEQEIQERLHREWANLKSRGLCALRDYFRAGGDAASVPKMFKAKTDSHSRTLTNYSTIFW